MRDYLRGEGTAPSFFAGSFRDPASFRLRSRELDERFPRGGRERAAALMEAMNPGTGEPLRRFVEEGGYVVTTGQQPGLFGGPLLSLYKGLTAVSLARALEDLLERPVLPLFWVASEDHDWAEADHTYLLDRENELRLLRLPESESPSRSPLHRVPLPEEGLKPVLDQFLGLLPATEFTPPLVRLLRESHPPGQTLSGAFLEIMGHLLAGHPLLFVDPAQGEIKAASLPILLRELEAAEEHERLLARAASHLEESGYHAQVPILEGGVNLFLEGPAGRDRLYREGRGFRLQHAGVHLTRGEMEAQAREDPSRLSPNVLLRPVVESALFPVLSYVAGPGEIAYFAQLRDLFESHGVGMPVVHPRFSATLVEARIGKILRKLHLPLEALGRPHHELAGEIAREETPPEVRRILGEIRGAIGKGSAALISGVKAVDPTLRGPVTHARNTALSAFTVAERKILQAVKRENQIALGQLEKAQRHLFPLGTPQERVVNPFYYLARYGPGLIGEIAEEFTVEFDAPST